MEICELEVGIDNTKSQIATSVEVLEQYKVQSKSLEEEVAEGKVSLKFVIRGRGEDIKKIIPLAKFHHMNILVYIKQSIA